jgi:hypothetical protein
MPSNIRELIARALHEAQEEFAAIVERKLAELMGDASAAAAPRRAPKATAKAPAKAAAKAAAKPLAKPVASGSRSRVPSDHMATLREKVLEAMPTGEAWKKGQIMAAAHLDEDEGQRVGLVLKRLKDEGLLVMRGQKGAATYALKAGKRREDADDEG